MALSEKERRARRLAWVRSLDWFFDDKHSAKFLPGCRHVALLPRIGNRWGAIVKHVKTGRISVSRATYSTPRKAQNAAFDWLAPADGEPACVWRDENGNTCEVRRKARTRAASQSALQAGVVFGLPRASSGDPSAVWRKRRGGGG